MTLCHPQCPHCSSHAAEPRTNGVLNGRCDAAWEVRITGVCR